MPLLIQTCTAPPSQLYGRQVQGMHLMRKMKEVREFDRKVVLHQIETIQRSHEEHPSHEGKTNVIENAINVVTRNKSSLAVGCMRKEGLNLSQLEMNRIALGLLDSVKRREKFMRDKENEPIRIIKRQSDASTGVESADGSKFMTLNYDSSSRQVLTRIDLKQSSRSSLQPEPKRNISTEMLHRKQLGTDDPLLHVGLLTQNNCLPYKKPILKEASSYNVNTRGVL